MRGISLLMAVLLALPVPAFAAIGVEKPVSRIDGLMATEKGGRITVQAKGAVQGGGWKHAALKPSKSTAPGDAHVLHEDLGNGRFRFAMTIRHRFFGMLFYQDGIFREEEVQ